MLDQNVVCGPFGVMFFEKLSNFVTGSHYLYFCNCLIFIYKSTKYLLDYRLFCIKIQQLSFPELVDIYDSIHLESSSLGQL